MKNWKTNLGGAVTSFGLAIVAIDPAWAKAGLVIAAVGALINGLAGRDFNVSTEQSVGTKQHEDKT